MVRVPATLLRNIDAMGVRATEAHWRLATPEVAGRLRPGTAHVGDGFLTWLEGSDSLRMNRVIALGHRGRAREAMIDEIIARYRAARVRRFSFLLNPGPQARRITGWLTRRGFTRKGGLTLLLRDARKKLAPLGSRLRIARAGREGRAAVVSIHAECFGAPANRRRWAMEAAAAPAYEQYLAWVGKIPVAVGTLRIEDDLAWLGGGATRTRWRRLGAHGALINARLRRAARCGCRWAWVETAMPAPGRPDGSRRNLIRLGFEEACLKPMFVWEER